MAQESVVDLDTLNEMKATMGADFVGELIDAYCQETPQLIAALQQALALGQALDFQHAAHSIKSTSASLGAMDLSRQARELEMMGKSGDLTGADTRLDTLAAGFASVMRRLEELRNEP